MGTLRFAHPTLNQEQRCSHSAAGEGQSHAQGGHQDNLFPSKLLTSEAMFEVFVKTQFAAGHHLRNYPGNCERPHGHNWEVTVGVRVTELDRLGMGIDFRTLKQALKGVIDELDHRDLNDHPAFRDRNPSSENLARHIHEALKGLVQSDRCQLHSVTVSETSSSWVTYVAE